MAGRAKRQQKRRSRRNQAPRRRRSGGKSSVGRLVARGVRSLLSTVPAVGSTLANFADFVFKGFGITDSKLEGDVSRVASYNSCLVSRFHLCLTSLIVGSRDVIQLDHGRKVACQYRDGRLISFTIKISPTNEADKRQGIWHLGVQPFFAPGDAEQFFELVSLPDEQTLKHMYLSTSGPASSSLSLTYRPRASDGQQYQFRSLTEYFCEVAILFTDYNRDTATQFTAAEFNCMTQVSGSVDLRGTPSVARQKEGPPYVYDVIARDLLKSTGYFLMSSVNGKTVRLGMDGLSIIDLDGKCTVTGKVLKDMEDFEDLTLGSPA